MKYLTFLFLVTLLSCSKAQNNCAIKGLTIDPNIKSEVEKHIIEQPEFEKYSNFMQLYGNGLHVESFENDSLVFVTTDFSKKLPFKSFYLWNKDTLSINGAYGLFGGTGFYIKIADNKAQVFHMLSSDDFPTYAYKKNDSLMMRLEVPCYDTKIILSEMPDATKNQIIYGYVAFKSKNFYSATGVILEDEEPERKKTRNNMKIYFRSGLLKRDNLKNSP